MLRGCAIVRHDYVLWLLALISTWIASGLRILSVLCVSVLLPVASLGRWSVVRLRALHAWLLDRGWVLRRLWH